MRLYSSLVSSTILYYVETKQKQKNKNKLPENFFYSCEGNFFVDAKKNFYSCKENFFYVCEDSFFYSHEKIFFIKVSQGGPYISEKVLL